MPWSPSYVSVAELASYTRIDDAVDDAELGLAAEAASRAVDEATNRQFGQVAAVEERVYVARPDFDRGCWVADTDDFQTATGLVVEIDGTAVATFVQEPRNAAQKGRPWTRLVFTADSEATPSTAPHEVAVTALWGWTAVPDTVVQATLLQGSRFFTRRQAPFGIAGSPDQGSELRLLARVDADVKVMLGGFTRLRAVG